MRSIIILIRLVSTEESNVIASNANEITIVSTLISLFYFHLHLRVWSYPLSIKKNYNVTQ